MDREKFTSLLLDVRLVEGTYGMDFERVDTMDRGIDKYFQQVFDKHGVSSRDFMTNYTFYSQNINDITAIEGEVIERLSKMQADLGMHNKPEEEKPKQ